MVERSHRKNTGTVNLNRSKIIKNETQLIAVISVHNLNHTQSNNGNAAKASIKKNRGVRAESRQWAPVSVLDINILLIEPL
jgi:hypothetical protein